MRSWKLINFLDFIKKFKYNNDYVYIKYIGNPNYYLHSISDLKDCFELLNYYIIGYYYHDGYLVAEICDKVVKDI